MKLNVFISHSSVDKQFARKLDATLSGQGVKVFLDERDIRIGDSIPRKVHEGLSNATHVIYVISSNSLKSKWVQDELDIAKMIQNERTGCVILPVLIEDIEVPIGFRHLRCANFVAWQDNVSFMKESTHLFAALKVEFKTAEYPVVSFMLANLDMFSVVERDMLILSGFIEGIFDADQLRRYIGDNPDKDIDETDTKDFDRFFSTSPWVPSGSAVYNYLHKPGFSDPRESVIKFVELLEMEYNIRHNETIKIMLELSKSLLTISEYSSSHVYSYKDSELIRNMALRLGGVVRDFRLEAMSIMGAGFVQTGDSGSERMKEKEA